MEALPLAAFAEHHRALHAGRLDRYEEMWSAAVDADGDPDPYAMATLDFGLTDERASTGSTGCRPIRDPAGAPEGDWRAAAGTLTLRLAGAAQPTRGRLSDLLETSALCRHRHLGLLVSDSIRPRCLSRHTTTPPPQDPYPPLVDALR